LKRSKGPITLNIWHNCTPFFSALLERQRWP